MFLLYADYQTTFQDQELVDLTGGDTSKVDHFTDVAVEYAKTQLRHHYDVEVDFAKTGTDRNPLLVAMVLKYAAYNLCLSLSSQNIDETRADTYKEAERFFNNCRRGTANPDFTLLDPEETGSRIFVTATTENQIQSKW